MAPPLLGSSTMNLRGALFASFATLACIAGCSTAEEEANAPPSDQLVFDATAETKAELGIARWGFNADPYEDSTSYRGYGENNEVLAAVVQKGENFPDRHVFTMTMTGPTASAVEKIEYYIEQPGSTEAQLMMDVTENSFAEGGLPARVLERFRKDSANAPASKGATGALLGAGQLVGDNNPTVEASRAKLVKYCPSEQAYRDAMGSCALELADWRTAAAGEGGSCSFLKRVKNPLIGCGVGAALTWETGPGAILGCLGGGAAGAITAQEECAVARNDNSKARERFDSCFRMFCPPSMRAR